MTKKRVKNINFRLKPHALMVSVPVSISSKQTVQAIAHRVPWAIANHPQVLERYKRKNSALVEPTADTPLLLWGCHAITDLDP